MPNRTDFPMFKFWCQKVLPLVYDDSLSYYEVLCKVVKYLNNLSDAVGDALNEIDERIGSYAQLRAELDTLQDEMNKVKNGQYTSMYIHSLEAWLNNNLARILGDMAKFVVFGLSADGYFCAYIPESLDKMRFDTIIDPTDQLYGHLIMKW